VRYEDGGRRRGRGRSRHLAILGDIGAGEVNYDEEGVWTTGRLNVYILCGNANKIYLDALWRRHAALPADYSRKCLRVQNVCRMCLPRDIPEKLLIPKRNQLAEDIIEACECLKAWWKKELIQQQKD
jgi:hypothetical protein